MPVKPKSAAYGARTAAQLADFDLTGETMPQNPVNLATTQLPITGRQAGANGNADAPYNPPGARNTDSCLPLRATGEVIHNYSSSGPAPGNIAFRWLYGSNVAALNRDPRIQAVQYNEDTYILRQNVCVHWQAPFTYLLFGNKGALLVDTGATPEPAYYPLRETVDAIIARWARIRRKTNLPLTVVMTSGEDIAQNRGLDHSINSQAGPTRPSCPYRSTR
jgi:hypothetical protein